MKIKYQLNIEIYLRPRQFYRKKLKDQFKINKIIKNKTERKYLDGRIFKKRKGKEFEYFLKNLITIMA